MENRGFFNLSWGMQFRTCKNFWERADLGLVLSQKFLQIQKPHRHYFDCWLDSADSQNLGKKINAKRSSHICHSKSFPCHIERSEESKKNNLVILSEAKYLKDKNRDSSFRTSCFTQNDNVGLDSSRYRTQNDNFGKECAESSLDSADLQGGLPREQSSLAMTDFNGLPRRFCESARNDEFILDSAYFIK